MPTLSSHIVKREVASVQDVEEALARQAQYGGDLVTNLLEFANVSEERLVRVIAESVGLEPAPPGELQAAADRVRRLVPGDIALRYGLYPLEQSKGKLVVAVSEPLPNEVASDLEFSLGLGLVQRATTLVRVQQAVSRDYGVGLDRRVARLIARLRGDQDPDPSIPPRPPSADRTPARVPTLKPLDRETPVERRPQAQNSPPNAGRPRPAAAIDWQAMARSERRPERQRRRLGPYTATMAELDLVEAETRDAVITAFFDFAAQYFEYSALFAVHGDLAEGRDAHGSGAPRAKVVAIGVPLDLPSTLASVVATDPYRLVRLSASGLDGALAKDLERRPGPVVLLLPIRVRERTVLVFYGDHGEMNVEFPSIGDVISFAPLVATALERAILKRKGRASQSRELPTTGIPQRDRARAQRVNLPSKHDRQSALASALVESPLRAASISNTPPLPDSISARPPESRAPSLARPMISIGPSRTASVPARPSPPVEGPRFSDGAGGGTSPQPPGARSVPAISRTPIPSSFAPGAPPHSPIPPAAKAPIIDDDAVTGEWKAVEIAAFAARTEADGESGSGSYDSSSLHPFDRSLTPVMIRQSPPPRISPRPPAAGEPAGPSRSAPPRPEPHGLSESNPAPEARSMPEVRPTAEAKPGADGRRLELVADAEPEPISDGELQVESGELFSDSSPDVVVLNADVIEELSADGQSIQIAPPNSRSIAHAARPLAPPGMSEELRLPTVIVDLAHDTEDLVRRLTEGDRAAAERLVEIGASAVPVLVGAFPGPITSELRRGVGDGPPRASLCGPVLEVLARIGPRAAGVLSVRTNDRNPAVRAWATRLLGEMPCMDAAHAVARRFIDEDPEVRRGALAAGRMLQSNPSAASVLVATLAEMLRDSGRTEGLVHMVIEALADLREARAIPALTTLLATGPAEVRRSAHWALVVLSRTDHGEDPAAWDEWYRARSSAHRIEWLIDALMHENQEIRRAAGDELKSLTKEYFGYYDDLPPRERERAQQRYREWWDTKGKARFAPQA